MARFRDIDDRFRPAPLTGLPTRRALLAGVLAASTSLPAAAQQTQILQQPPPLGPRRSTPVLAAGPRPIEITSTPILNFDRLKSARRDLGRLQFRGGLVLASPAPEFGGWSGILLSEDSRRIMMISDRASWLTAEMIYEANRPVRLANATLGEISGMGGVALRGRDRDAEALTLLDGNLTRGTVLIAFERNHRIGRFPLTERGLGAPSGYLKLPAEGRRMSTNKGLEAAVVVRSGVLKSSVIAFAEELHDAQRNHTGWIWPGGIGAEAQRITMTNIGDFAVTDLAALPDGNLIVLERKFRWLEGVKLRLRLLRAATVKPGAMLEGEVLLEADMSSEIDNMEGLAISRDARGQIVLTLVSDNNFNALLQRTMLLQFTLTTEQAGQAASPKRP